MMQLGTGGPTVRSRNNSKALQSWARLPEIVGDPPHFYCICSI